MWDQPATEKRNVMRLWRERAEEEQRATALNMPVRITVRHDDLQVHEVSLSFPAALFKRALGMRVDPFEISLSEVQSAFIAPVGAGFTTHALDRPELTLVTPLARRRTRAGAGRDRAAATAPSRPGAPAAPAGAGSAGGWRLLGDPDAGQLSECRAGHRPRRRHRRLHCRPRPRRRRRRARSRPRPDPATERRAELHVEVRPRVRVQQRGAVGPRRRRRSRIVA